MKEFYKREMKNLKVLKEALQKVERVLITTYHGYNVETTLYETIEYLKSCGLLPKDFPNYYYLSELSSTVDVAWTYYRAIELPNKLIELINRWNSLINNHKPIDAGWISLKEARIDCEKNFIQNLISKKAYALGKEYINLFIELVDYVVSQIPQK